MNVKALQQFLHSLIEPLRSGGAAEKHVADLQRISEGLEPFLHQPVDEFADFLARSQDYEQQGHWPRQEPAIRGQVVDEPTISDYAERLKKFLEAAVPASGPMSPAVPDELKRLTVRLKLSQLKELAQALGVAEPGKTGAVVLERIFRQLTGRELKAAVLEVQAHQLQELAGKPGLNEKLQELGKVLKITELKNLAKILKVPGKITTKIDALNKIREQLAGPGSDGSTLHASFTPAVPDLSSDPKITQIVETLNALKTRAELDNAPYEEIEAELRRLEGELNREEAIAAAQAFGVAWKVDTKSDALDKIRRRVFELKRARESIQY